MRARLRLWFSNLVLDYKIKTAQRNAEYENRAFRQARSNEVAFQAQAQRLIKQRCALNRQQFTASVADGRWDAK